MRMRIAFTPGMVTAASVTRKLLDGWDRVHLRMPQASAEQVLSLIEGVPTQLRPRLTLHDHFRLAPMVGGVHLNSRNPHAPTGWQGLVSRSCHSVDEVLAADSWLSYVTLSPVFNSISKPGYNAAFTPEELARLAQARVPVIALGGVSGHNLRQLDYYPFAGYAMLGALSWDD